MKRLLYSVMIFITIPTVALFKHDRAVYAAQQGDWEKAESLLTQVVSSGKQSPSMMFDAGVAAYKQGNMDKALEYFSAVTDMSDSSSQQREQAYFNMGNALVENKELKKALQAYEQALKIMPDDERALHNRDIVKKMLEQQQQQQKQDKKDSDKKQQEKNKDKPQDSSAGGNQESSDQQEQDTSKSDKGTDNNSGKGNSNDNAKEPDNKKRQQPNKGSNEQKKDLEQDKAGTEQQAKGKESKHDDSLKHGPEQKMSDQGTSKDKKKQGAKANQQQGDGLEKVDAALAQLLKEHEQKDAQLNKRMMKAAVGNQLAGNNGQNCW